MFSDPSRAVAGGHVPVSALALFALLLSALYGSSARAEAEFRAEPALSLRELTRAVEQGSPSLARARRNVATSEAEARQARLWGNPSLDVSWSTLPLGATNPTDLSRPFANVPSYGIGVGYTIPVAKRAPRRRRAELIAQGASAELAFDTRERALALGSVLGELATASVRREAMQQLVSDGERAAELAEARLRAQFGTPLDVDQVRIEVERTVQLLASVDADIELALATCAGLVGTRCQNFADARAARAYLERWLAPRVTTAKLDGRADLRALSAYAEAARSEEKLAHAERLPDPTVRLGYLHDRFLASGNQQNSLALSVSVPLPLFDWGRYREQSARASRDSLTEEQQQRRAVAEARMPALERALALSRGRCQHLAHDVIPRAQSVLMDLEAAVRKRLLPMTQVIQARRTVSELVLEEAASCGDAYTAAVELVRESATDGEVQ